MFGEFFRAAANALAQGATVTTVAADTRMATTEVLMDTPAATEEAIEAETECPTSGLA